MRGYETSRNQNTAFGDEITQQLRLARREKFRIEEEKRINQEIELQSYLNLLIDEDTKRKLEEVYFYNAHRKRIISLQPTISDNNVELEECKEIITEKANERKRELNDLFSKVSFNLINFIW